MTARANVATQAEAVYDLYHKLLTNDTEAHWDQIISDMHTKDPWTDFIGVKHKGMGAWTQESLKVCIEFHKLTVFTVDTAERLKYYLMCHVKKPVRYTIRHHIARMEVLNKYVGLIPIIKNSPKAVASTEFRYIPFSKATLASVILATLPPVWRNQYSLTHSTVPETTIAMIDSLESIETLFIEKGHEKARALLKPIRRLAIACLGSACKREAPRKEPLRKAVLPSTAVCEAAGGSFNTHDTAECRGFEKDGTPKSRSIKPFDSAKKPWKKPGNREASQITYLIEKVAKLEKKLEKKKNSKKGAHDSLDSDSDSD